MDIALEHRSLSLCGVPVPRIITGDSGARYKLISGHVWDDGWNLMGLRARYKLPLLGNPVIMVRDLYEFCKNPWTRGFLEIHPSGWGDAKCKTYVLEYVVRKDE